jgi:enoyl-CoA hydratase/carnithine racemase
MFETVAYGVADGIATIRLNRPERLNAINQRMHQELPRVWQAFRQDPAARVAIVSGAGDRAFCSGADVADLPQLDFADPAGRALVRWSSLQNQVWKPVICAVNGMVVGGGLHFVADADIVLAAEHATFCDSHVSVGLVAGLEPVSLLPRMPMQALLRMVLMGAGERLPADRACALGLVGEVVPADRLEARARALASVIAGNCPSALAASKRLLWQALEQPQPAALDGAWRAIAAHNQGPDFAEGIAAFRERRPPRWLPPDPGPAPSESAPTATDPTETAP